MKRALLSVPLATLACALAFAACDEKKTSVIYDMGDGGVGAGGPGPVGKGVGEACAGDTECRPGLVCQEGACAPGHTLEAGADCVITAECQQELYCAGGKCAPAGSGGDGEACVTDADCQNGFRCTLIGLNAVCLPEGTGDLGGDCQSSGDCYGGLACVEGKCGLVPPGIPPYGLPWGGVECEEGEADKVPVEAYFHIPRGDDSDKDFFRLPIPNDVRLDNGKLDLSGYPTPGTGFIGFDLVQRYVDALESEADGWGVHQAVYFRFSGALDLDSFKEQVKVVNLTDGQQMGYFYAYASGGGKYMCNHRVAVSRPDGRVWEPGKTYGIYFLNGIKTGDGEAVSQPADLAALLGDTAPSDPAVAPHYDKYKPLRDYLVAEMIDPKTILNASVFTIGHPRAVVEKLQGVIDGESVTASDWTLCDTGVKSPCPDAEGDRACPAASPDFHELHALVELPIFQEGTAPYLEPEDGGNVKTSGGIPQVVRKEKVCLSLAIPKNGTMPPGGWPTVVFAHGTGGSFRSHVLSKLADDFAKGVDNGLGTVVQAAVLGIDQVQHGPRRNGSQKSPNDLFFNFANPKAARGNPQQGAADQMALLRFVPAVNLDGALTGTPFNLHPSNIVFWGHSQGATEGAIATPYGPWSGVLFSGQGASLKDSLVTKTSPVNIAGLLPFVLQDFDKEGKLVHGSRHVVLNLLQHWIDAADPIAYARLLSVEPPSGVAAHHQLQIYGVKDTFTTSRVQTLYALNAGIALVAHDGSAAPPDEIGTLMEVPAPASGNLVVDMKTVSGFVRQYGPSDGDGHFVVFDVAAARGDAERFIAGALSGVTPQVGK